jgi:hypothetical protein
MTKLCKDCKHFSVTQYCKHKNAISNRESFIGIPTYYLADSMRLWGGCGYNATLFEPKIITIIKTAITKMF